MGAPGFSSHFGWQMSASREWFSWVPQCVFPLVPSSGPAPAALHPSCPGGHRPEHSTAGGVFQGQSRVGQPPQALFQCTLCIAGLGHLGSRLLSGSTVPSVTIEDNVQIVAEHRGINLQH